MALQVGTALGPYRIDAPIGAGGLGEVYRARDTKLDRDVALKILSEAFTSDAERLARFQREAKVLASLNHPNIGAIYGLEDKDETHALVLELVEGPTLADRIAQGPIPVDETLPIGKQIAEALEAAHEQGIIHRDLKPANIKLRPDGTVKVLDFGLAKAMEGEQVQGDQANSPTLTAAASQLGVIMGTAAYMSPEQARGRAVDRRADIWAFGVVLFEMLTGKRAFEGENVSLTLAEVIKSDPHWEALPADLSSNLRRLVRRCLTKDVRQRLQHIGDARIELSDPSPPPWGVTEGSTAPGRVGLGWAFGVVGLLAAVLLGTFIGRGWRSTNSPEVVRRFEILTRDAQVIGANGGRVLGLSQDGQRLAYVDRSTIYVRNLVDGSDRVAAPGARRSALVGSSPFFSPDGEWLAYSLGGTLETVWLGGEGESRTFCAQGAFGGGVWTDDGVIIFSDGRSLWTVPSSGGECRRLVSGAQDGTTRYLLPQALPGGEVLLAEMREGDRSQAVLISRAAGERVSVALSDAVSPRYLATGHLVFLRGETLFAMPFDARTLEATGEPVPVLDNVSSDTLAHLDISTDGTLAYVPVNASAELGLVWVDRSGREERIDVRPDSYWAPRVSPNGERLVVALRRPETRLEVVALTTGTQDLFAQGVWPAWTRDGQRIAFRRALREGGGMWWRAVQDRDAAPEPVRPDGPGVSGGFVLSFSADPVVLTFYQVASSARDVWVMPVDPPGEPTPVVATDGDDMAPNLSPDARYLAYASDVSGSGEVYVTTCGPCRPDLDLPSRTWRVSIDGGAAPVWSADGRELFYLQGTTMMAVSVRTDPEFDFDPPVRLFEGNGYVPDQFGNQNYDVSPDGQRFVMVKRGSALDSRHRINVVINWFRELNERVSLD